jgi:hypothetical protein
VWAIRLNDKYFGPCISKSQATTVAISAAGKAMLEGCSARVLVQYRDGFRTVWSNGRSGKPASEAA